MITYTVSNVVDCMQEVSKLLEAHYDELSVNKGFKLNPDYKRYYIADKINQVKVILCKDDDVIVGYIVFFLMKDLHYQDCLLAAEDIYYLKPEYRKGRTGIKMFKFAEDYLKTIGVNLIKYSTKVHLDNSALFEYLGYTHIEKIFTKNI